MPSGTDMYQHAKFHADGVTIAEISVTGQIHIIQT